MRSTNVKCKNKITSLPRHVLHEISPKRNINANRECIVLDLKGFVFCGKIVFSKSIVLNSLAFKNSKYFLLQNVQKYKY